MSKFELKPGFFFTGALDHDLRVFDIIMYTEYGTTYNSYVLKTENHTVLFETAKAKCLDSWLEKVGRSPLWSPWTTWWSATPSPTTAAAWSVCWSSTPG